MPRCVFCGDAPSGSESACGELRQWTLGDGEGVWCHEKCALWSSGIVAGPSGVTGGLLATEVRRMRGPAGSSEQGKPRFPCSACGGEGAMIGCFNASVDAATGRLVQCNRQYHYGCALKKGCVLATRGQHPAADWFPQGRAWHRGRRNALYCARGQCEMFGCGRGVEAACRDCYGDAPQRRCRRFVDSLVHAHPAYRATEGVPWRTIRAGEDVLLNTGGAPWPCRILKIFWEVEEESEPGLEESEGLQITVQWFHRPGDEILGQWSTTRKDELVWISPSPADPDTFGTNWVSNFLLRTMCVATRT
jgi:hypothetical protein